LQEYTGIPRRKRSQQKATWPGHKQIYRQVAEDGALAGDWLYLEDRPYPGEPLLQLVMHAEQKLTKAESLESLRERVRRQLAALPAALRANRVEPYPVVIAPELQALAAEMDRHEH
jgi:nicotinate phosphoribosyltransferase